MWFYKFNEFGISLLFLISAFHCCFFNEFRLQLLKSGFYSVASIQENLEGGGNLTFIYTGVQHICRMTQKCICQCKYPLKKGSFQNLGGKENLEGVHRSCNWSHYLCLLYIIFNWLIIKRKHLVNQWRNFVKILGGRKLEPIFPSQVKMTIKNEKWAI